MRRQPRQSAEVLLAKLQRATDDAIQTALEARELVVELVKQTINGGDDPVTGLMAALDKVDVNWRHSAVYVSLFSGPALRAIVAEQVDLYHRREGGEWVPTTDRDQAIESQLDQIREFAEKYNLKPVV